MRVFVAEKEEKQVKRINLSAIFSASPSLGITSIVSFRIAVLLFAVGPTEQRLFISWASFSWRTDKVIVCDTVFIVDRKLCSLSVEQWGGSDQLSWTKHRCTVGWHFLPFFTSDSNANLSREKEQRRWSETEQETKKREQTKNFLPSVLHAFTRVLLPLLVSNWMAWEIRKHENEKPYAFAC